MINLLKNVFKYTNRGHIKILVAYDFLHETLKVHIGNTNKQDRGSSNSLNNFGKDKNCYDLKNPNSETAPELYIAQQIVERLGG